jgi:hypothetical protein
MQVYKVCAVRPIGIEWFFVCGLVAVIRVLTCSDCIVWDVVEPFDLVLCTASVCFVSSKLGPLQETCSFGKGKKSEQVGSDIALLVAH